MAFVPIRRTRLCQPRGDGVDWSNPLTRGLIDVIDMSGAIPRSVLLNTPATPFGTAPVAGVNKFGKTTDSTAGFGGWLFSRSDGRYTPAGECTHVFIGEVSAFSGQYAGLFATADDTGANNHSVFAYKIGTDGFLGGTTVYSTAPGALAGVALAGPVVIVATFAANKCNVWVNGVNTAKDIDGGILNGFSTSRLVLFGERGSTSVYSVKGKAANHLFYGRALKVGEAMLITANPWQVFL